MIKPAFDRSGGARPIKSMVLSPSFLALLFTHRLSGFWILMRLFPFAYYRLIAELSELSAHVAEIVPLVSCGSVAVITVSP